jgi:hypothetical protein
MIASIGLGMLMLFTGPTARWQEPAAFDVCSLYPLAEFAAFARDEGRRHRTTPRSFGGVSTSSCWHGTQYDSLALRITVERGRDKAGLAMYLASLRKMASPTGKPQQVPNLGDEAFWGQLSPTSGQIHVVLGTDLVTIQTYGKGSGAGQLAKTRELATIIIERYKKAR